MKKSQILAALALAFALGVVAPVTGVMNASAITVDEVKDTATKESLSNAIGNVKNNANYQAYNTLYTATGAGTAANAWDDIDEDTYMANINTALLSADGSAGLYVVKADLKPADYEAAKTLADAIKNAEGVSKLIPEYQALISAINNTEKPANYDTLVSLANKAGLAIDDDSENKDAGALKDAIKANNVYKAYESLNTALTGATKAVTDQGTHIKDLKEALAAADDVITPTMIAEAATITKDNTTPVAELVDLANTAVASSRGTKYVALIQEVTTAEGVLKNAATTPEGYATAIKNLNTDYKAATGADLSLDTPTTPENPDEPGTDEPGTDEPSTDDPSAPGTGVVSAAEGNAATTVSIVAGLATALTALGAGVVAYRSARRSNK